MKQIRKIFYWLYLAPFRLFIQSDSQHSYHGPMLGSELDPLELARLHSYRLQFYKNHLPYLYPSTEEACNLELEKDRRSLQIWCRDQTGQIVGSCMFTPFPFEISYAIDSVINEEHKDFLEISRLLVTKQGQGIGMKLLFKAGPHIVPPGIYRGVIGICKPVRLSMFSLVGMKVIGEVILKERNSQTYKVISATMGRMTFAMNLLALKSLVAEFFSLPQASFKYQIVNWSLVLFLGMLTLTAIAG